MFEITSRKTEQVTPEKATEWLGLNTFMSQRALRQNHVKQLSTAILEGNFTTGNIAFATNAAKTRTELVNGQHQLHAILKTGIPIIANIEVATCESMQDVSQYFSQFDVGAVRSIRDIVKAESDSLSLDWPVRVASMIASAAEYIDDKHKYRNPDKTKTRYERAKRIENLVSEGNFVNELCAGENARMLCRVPVVVAMIMTFYADQCAATEFWESVRMGTNFNEKDPRRFLRDYLMSTPITLKSAKAKEASSAKEITTRCIVTWNTWRRGEKRQTLSRYIPEADFPEVSK